MVRESRQSASRFSVSFREVRDIRGWPNQRRCRDHAVDRRHFTTREEGVALGRTEKKGEKKTEPRRGRRRCFLLTNVCTAAVFHEGRAEAIDGAVRRGSH